MSDHPTAAHIHCHHSPYTDASSQESTWWNHAPWPWWSGSIGTWEFFFTKGCCLLTSKKERGEKYTSLPGGGGGGGGRGGGGGGEGVLQGCFSFSRQATTKKVCASKLLHFEHILLFFEGGSWNILCVCVWGGGGFYSSTPGSLGACENSESIQSTCMHREVEEFDIHYKKNM